MKAGLAIVLFALMGTILAGSIGFSTSPTVETEYERVSDLNPIVSSEAVTGDELYNPTTNQTGWSNVNYQTQTAPSIYSIANAGTYSSWSTGTTTLFDFGGVYYKSNAGSATSSGSSIVWSDGSNGMTLQDHVMGGYSGQTNQVVTSDNRIYRATWTVSFGTSSGVNGVYWQDLTYLATQNNWGGVILTTTNWVRPAELQFTSNGSADQKIVTLHVEPLAYQTGTRYYFDQSRSGWYEITGTGVNNVPLLASTATALYWWDSSYNGANASILNGEIFTPGAVTYIKPYSQVGISAGDTATWSNGYENTKVQLIVESGATITVGGVAYTVGSSSFEYILVTLSPDGYYYQGITDYISPTDYSLLSYQYPITASSLVSSISELSVSGSSMAYVVNTWVPIDPASLLWSNPTLNINDYFPDIVSAGARVYISSVLTTGDSLTINGATYTTGDKKILVNGSLYNLNGIGIDYRTDGHTYIVTTNGKTIDLGETTTYVISGSGVWYWSSEIDSIVTTIGTQTDILFAQSPDKNWMVFAFAGLIVIGLVGIAAIGRGSLDGWDWIISIVAIIMALMLVI